MTTCDQIKHELAEFDENEVFQERWIMNYKIAEGGFGVIWAAVHVSTGKKVAVKLEKKKARRPLLRMEIMIMCRLRSWDTHTMPMLDCGVTPCGLKFVVMNRVGENLGNLRKSSPFHRFDLSTSIRAARQMLQATFQVHSIGCIHRDIKPSNFCIGTGAEAERKIYLIDFGLARQYVNGEGRVRDPRCPAPYRGTLSYCSINAMQKIEQERRDDLISLLYLLVEMLRGDLPWRARSEGIHRPSFKQWVLSVKIKYRASPNLFLKGLPYQLFKWHRYVMGLNYGEDPNYKTLDHLLGEILNDNGIKEDDKYAWQINNSHHYHAQAHKNRIKSAKSSPRLGSSHLISLPGEQETA